jgi:hypothetical protein
MLPTSSMRRVTSSSKPGVIVKFMVARYAASSAALRVSCAALCVL